MGDENKKMNIRVIMLRILSVLAVNAFVYAGFTMLRASIFHDDGGITSVVLYAVVICLAHTAGILFSSTRPAILNRAVKTKFFRFISFMLNIKDNELFISSSAIWGLIIVPVAAVFIVYGGNGPGRSFFELLPAAAAYIISVKQSRLAPSRIMSSASLFIGMTIMVICLELPYLISRLMYLRPPYFAVSYFLIFAFLIVKNQEDIEKQIFSKKHIDKSVLPRNLRRFNAMAAGFIFLFTMLLFNLKAVVMYLMDIARQIIQLVFYFFGWLIDKLITGRSSGLEANQGNLNAMPVQQPMPIFNLIINIVMYFVILYISYRLLLSIVVRVPAAVSKIIGALKKLFKMNISNEANVEADFIDTTETVMPDVKNMVSRVTKKRGRAKKLSQITDPAEKVRRMYGNILGRLPLYGIKPEAADTTAEILAKAAGAVEVQESLSPFTEIYDQVRYGEMMPDSETLARAEKHYLGVSQDR